MNKTTKTVSVIIMTMLAILTGYFFTVAFKSYTIFNANDNIPKYQVLITYIEKLEEETTKLEQDIITMRAQIDTFQQEQPEDNRLNASLQADIAALNKQIGLQEMTGTGLIITLDDNAAGAELAHKANPSTYNPEKFIIHYSNLLYIVRELATTAQAISINGIRITDSFNIRCVGTVIMVNSARLAPPYKITAIGDQLSLEKILNNSSEYLYLKNNNMPVKYSLEPELTVPAAVITINVSGITAISE